MHVAGTRDACSLLSCAVSRAKSMAGGAQTKIANSTSGRRPGPGLPQTLHKEWENRGAQQPQAGMEYQRKLQKEKESLLPREIRRRAFRREVDPLHHQSLGNKPSRSCNST